MHRFAVSSYYNLFRIAIAATLKMALMMLYCRVMRTTMKGVAKIAMKNVMANSACFPVNRVKSSVCVDVHDDLRTILGHEPRSISFFALALRVNRHRDNGF